MTISWKARLCSTAAAACAGLALFAASGSAATVAGSFSTDGKTPCVYPVNSIATLNAFSAMVGQQINCVQVYNDGTTTWQEWDDPWFIHDSNPDQNWSQWATTAGTDRELIISADLAPNSVTSQSNWLSQGASGAYTSYAVTLAKNLVAAGLGGSVIRIAPEANGNWNADSLGSTEAQYFQWGEFWRKTVRAMRSVSGAHFLFNWSLNVNYRALPLKEIYPGNAYVDSIGIDVYDTSNFGSTTAERWNAVDTGPMGVQAIANFAAANGKPISFPEWGVQPLSAGVGVGDDPGFINDLSSVINADSTTFQSYFYQAGYATQLAPGTQSLAAYTADFG